MAVFVNHTTEFTAHQEQEIMEPMGIMPAKVWEFRNIFAYWQTYIFSSSLPLVPIVLFLCYSKLTSKFSHWFHVCIIVHIIFTQSTPLWLEGRIFFKLPQKRRENKNTRRKDIKFILEELKARFAIPFELPSYQWHPCKALRDHAWTFGWTSLEQPNRAYYE